MTSTVIPAAPDFYAEDLRNPYAPVIAWSITPSGVATPITPTGPCVRSPSLVIHFPNGNILKNGVVLDDAFDL